LQELPEIDLEATVLNRLAVLEVVCKSQAQTISVLQAENSRLISSLAASTSNTEVCSALLYLRLGFRQSKCMLSDAMLLDATHDIS
jgi:hypothetical protein